MMEQPPNLRVDVSLPAKDYVHKTRSLPTVVISPVNANQDGTVFKRLGLFDPPQLHHSASDQTSVSPREKHRRKGRPDALGRGVSSALMRPGLHIQIVQGRHRGKRGLVRFVGEVAFAHGIWIGVSLEEPQGTCNGSKGGERYFKCEENHGLFLKAAQMMPSAPPSPASPLDSPISASSDADDVPDSPALFSIPGEMSAHEMQKRGTVGPRVRHPKLDHMRRSSVSAVHRRSGTVDSAHSEFLLVPRTASARPRGKGRAPLPSAWGAIAVPDPNAHGAGVTPVMFYKGAASDTSAASEIPADERDVLEAEAEDIVEEKQQSAAMGAGSRQVPVGSELQSLTIDEADDNGGAASRQLISGVADDGKSVSAKTETTGTTLPALVRINRVLSPKASVPWSGSSLDSPSSKPGQTPSPRKKSTRFSSAMSSGGSNSSRTSRTKSRTPKGVGVGVGTTVNAADMPTADSHGTRRKQSEDSDEVPGLVVPEASALRSQSANPSPVTSRKTPSSVPRRQQGVQDMEFNRQRDAALERRLVELKEAKMKLRRKSAIAQSMLPASLSDAARAHMSVAEVHQRRVSVRELSRSPRNRDKSAVN